MIKGLTLKKQIDLLETAYENKLTEETIKNLAESIRTELISREKYEYCTFINKLEKFQLRRFEIEKENLVKNVGLSKKEMEKLMSLI